MAKKPLAALLIAMKKKPSKDESEPVDSPSEEMGEDEGLMVAAEDVMSAIETKDAGALVAALRSFVEQC